MQKWFIFKNRGRGSIWSTSCFLSCPQTRAVKTFLWNMWQADMQRLSVTGTQRTQVQILPCLNSCGAVSQRMKWHWFKTVVSLNTVVFTLCQTEMIPRKGESVWSPENFKWSVGWALSSILRADSKQHGLKRFGAIKVLTCLAFTSAVTLFRTWIEIATALNTWCCKEAKVILSHGWGNFLKGHILLCNSLSI